VTVGIQYLPRPRSRIVRSGDASRGIETVSGKSPLRRLELLLLAVTCRDQQVIAVAPQIPVSEGEIRHARAAAGFLRVVEIDLEFEPLVILLGFEVDHTRDRVR